MKNDIYRIPEKNYKLILDYFETTYKNINGYLNNIKKFKDISNDYCRKVKALFNEVKSNNNRKISFDCIETGTDNEKIDNNISKINKFFNGFIESLETFIESISSPIETFHRNIEIYNEEISSIKFIHEEEKKSFINKYSDFGLLSNQLHTLYNDVEKKLINYCISRRKKIINII